MKTLKAFFDFREGEYQPALLMAGFFFSAMTVFQILKPLKKGLFVEHIGAELQLIAKVLNILVAIGAMVVFTYLYNRLGGRRLVYVLGGLFLAALLVFSTLVSEAPSKIVNWSFYLFGDLWSTVWVATFWAFLNEISTPDQSKRLYGVIGAGGTLGGLLGVTLVVLLVRQYSPQLLLLLCAGLTVAILLLVWRTDKLAQQPNAALTYRRDRPAKPEAAKSNAVTEGAKLVLASKYLLAIVGIMGLYELCSAMIDFQFSTASETISGSRATTFFIAQIYLITNTVAVVVQLFFTSFVMRRFGLGPALMILPLAMALSSGLFMVVPTLMFAGLLNVADNGFNYSINQTARESLYVPTSSDEQYKARAFTNMFVQRAGKGVATVISAVFILIGVRWLSLVTIAVTVLWMTIATFAGRRFHEFSEEEEQRVAA
ncbi:MFS transporter [Acidobacteria bacterium AH-259-O06]|nr:MFS transporter [Acidobacteria bacterium AH-259-O06]